RHPHDPGVGIGYRDDVGDRVRDRGESRLGCYECGDVVRVQHDAADRDLGGSIFRGHVARVHAAVARHTAAAAASAASTLESGEPSSSLENPRNSVPRGGAYMTAPARSTTHARS